jgi:hypothetical protein
MAAVVGLLTAAPAHAASVYVRHESIREIDPALATFTDATHDASADLAAGAFLAFATAPSQGTFTTTAAGLQNQLIFTNNNPFPITRSAGSLSAHISGAYSVVNPAFAVGTQVDSLARLTVQTTGATGGTFTAEHHHALRRNGNPASDQNIVTPLSTNGASVVVTQATFTDLDVDLLMPTLTLAPGAAMRLSFQLDMTVNGLSESDFFSTGGAQLSLVLPAGVTLDNDFGTLNWVTVPEPSAALLLGAVGLLGLARAGRQVRNSEAMQ